MVSGWLREGRWREGGEWMVEAAGSWESGGWMVEDGWREGGVRV